MATNTCFGCCGMASVCLDVPQWFAAWITPSLDDVVSMGFTWPHHGVLTAILILHTGAGTGGQYFLFRKYSLLISWRWKGRAEGFSPRLFKTYISYPPFCGPHDIVIDVLFRVSSDVSKSVWTKTTTPLFCINKTCGIHISSIIKCEAYLSPTLVNNVCSPHTG